MGIDTTISVKCTLKEESIPSTIMVRDEGGKFV